MRSAAADRMGLAGCRPRRNRRRERTGTPRRTRRVPPPTLLRRWGSCRRSTSRRMPCGRWHAFSPNRHGLSPGPRTRTPWRSRSCRDPVRRARSAPAEARAIARSGTAPQSTCAAPPLLLRQAARHRDRMPRARPRDRRRCRNQPPRRQDRALRGPPHRGAEP